MKQYFAYTRVSTVRQGTHGVSLQEQKSEIDRYARQSGMAICAWFAEQETAAKQGRRIFADMMARLRQGEAGGVIIHKIDRSARNLKDWADIAQLTDDGFEVHFTKEALDLQSSSGRLSADVQAVVAANYVRNLREETIKGFYGRLKQGIYPMPAPIGYLDAGAGKPKIIDPLRGPLVTKAFEDYATQRYSLATLVERMRDAGLRTKSNAVLGKTAFARILKSTFYYGLISIKKNGAAYVGGHRPLITKQLYDTVQEVIEGRAPRIKARRSYLFSRLILCAGCGRHLVADPAKGHVYYRCHSLACRGTSIREEVIEGVVRSLLARLHPSEDDLKELDGYLEDKRRELTGDNETEIGVYEMQIGLAEERLRRLEDALVNGHIDGASFAARKKTLLSERLDMEGKIAKLSTDPSWLLRDKKEFVQLVKDARLLYETGNFEVKRNVVVKTMSKLEVRFKSIDFEMRYSMEQAAARIAVLSGAPYADTYPTSHTAPTSWKECLDNLDSASVA